MYSRISSIPTSDPALQQAVRRVILYLALFAFAQSVYLILFISICSFPVQYLPAPTGNRGRVAAKYFAIPIPHVRFSTAPFIRRLIAD